MQATRFVFPVKVNTVSITFLHVIFHTHSVYGFLLHAGVKRNCQASLPQLPIKFHHHMSHQHASSFASNRFILCNCTISANKRLFVAHRKQHALFGRHKRYDRKLVSRAS
jgi:hypothetical protein